MERGYWDGRQPVGRSLIFQSPGKIQFGERDGSVTPRVAAVAQYLTACGIENEPCTDILYKQWHKLMINVGLNQASAAFGMTYGGLAQDNAQRPLMLSAMQEVIRLANAEGAAAPDDDVRWLAGAIPASGRTASPAWARMWTPAAPPRWRSFRGWSGVCRPDTACPPRPTISLPRHPRHRGRLA